MIAGSDDIDIPVLGFTRRIAADDSVTNRPNSEDSTMRFGWLNDATVDDPSAVIAAPEPDRVLIWPVRKRLVSGTHSVIH